MNVLQQFGNIPVSAATLRSAFSHLHFPQNKLAALEKSGAIIRVKKNLYVVAQGLISRELVANHLYGPSYLSLQSALAYYGMIPERVYSVLSMTLKRSKTYRTPLGEFSYQTVNASYFHLGSNQEPVAQSYTFLLASPTKAICDMIVGTPNLRIQSVSALRDYLFADMRLDFDLEQLLDRELVQQCCATGTKAAILRLLLEL